MAASDMEAWLTDSNEALTMRLVRTPEQVAVLGNAEEDTEVLEPFQPSFTYPIFGEKEKIFGYKGLQIQMDFASSSLKQYLRITYKDKISSKATPADDIEQILFKFIPPDFTKSEEAFQKSLEDDAASFTPPGKLFSAYKAATPSEALGGIEYEIYHCDWQTPGFKDFHRRMQIFILLYIEGGSYIQEDEDNWEFLILFQKVTPPADSAETKPSYHFAGYTSAYPFWCFPEHVRLRLSQFVIAPPFQGGGHGSQLYNALYTYALSLPLCTELTIEDPSEHFEDLRDRNDLRRMMLPPRGESTNGQSKGKGKGKGKQEDQSTSFAESEEMRNGAPVDKEWLKEKMKEGKYAKRQFERLVEMLLLRRLDRDNMNDYRAYRLQVKERLYRFNYSLLSQIPIDERISKLDETYLNVEEDYERILDSMEEGRGWRWVDIPAEKQA